MAVGWTRMREMPRHQAQLMLRESDPSGTRDTIDISKGHWVTVVVYSPAWLALRYLGDLYLCSCAGTL